MRPAVAAAVGGLLLAWLRPCLLPLLLAVGAAAHAAIATAAIAIGTATAIAIAIDKRYYRY